MLLMFSVTMVVESRHELNVGHNISQESMLCVCVYQHNLVAFVGIVVAHSSKPWPSICSIYGSAPQRHYFIFINRLRESASARENTLMSSSARVSTSAP